MRVQGEEIRECAWQSRVDVMAVVLMMMTTNKAALSSDVCLLRSLVPARRHGSQIAPAQLTRPLYLHLPFPSTNPSNVSFVLSLSLPPTASLLSPRH